MSNKSSENRDAVKAVGKTDVFYPDKTRINKRKQACFTRQKFSHVTGRRVDVSEGVM